MQNNMNCYNVKSVNETSSHNKANEKLKKEIFSVYKRGLFKKAE